MGGEGQPSPPRGESCAERYQVQVADIHAYRDYRDYRYRIRSDSVVEFSCSQILHGIFVSYPAHRVILNQKYLDETVSHLVAHKDGHDDKCAYGATKSG